jgi:hypothetical protein
MPYIAESWYKAGESAMEVLYRLSKDEEDTVLIYAI